ncbi:MAG: alpha/beta hydrolase, partial [Myxococcota bacterium]
MLRTPTWVTGLALLLTLMATTGAIGLTTALTTPVPSTTDAADVFRFGDLTPIADETLPEVQRYLARDGTPLAMRVYPSQSDRILIFVHGSSYHGAAYHPLAAHIRASGAATVVLPNLRGHYLSGRDRGDVAYIGQLEDDLADLIGELRHRRMDGEVTVAGHSSGGGFAIRFAGGPHGALADRVAVLAPMIPYDPFIRGGDAGGWARADGPRFLGLVVLNLLGIDGLNGLPVIAFAKPHHLWDGTETLVYSYRLNASYHPRYAFADDLAALPPG